MEQLRVMQLLKRMRCRSSVALAQVKPGLASLALAMSRALPLALVAAAFGALAFVGSPKRVESSATALRAESLDIGLGDPQRSGGLLECLV